MPVYVHLTGAKRAEQEYFLGELTEHPTRPDFVEATHLIDGIDDDLEFDGIPAPEFAMQSQKDKQQDLQTVTVDLTGSTDNFDISNAETRTLTATLKRGSDTVEDDDATVVTFAKTAGTGTVGGLGTATVTDGVAEKEITSTGEAAGSITITASAPGYVSDTITFTVVA